MECYSEDDVDPTLENIKSEDNNEDKCFLCPFCKVTFNDKTTLKKHVPLCSPVKVKSENRILFVPTKEIGTPIVISDSDSDEQSVDRNIKNEEGTLETMLSSDSEDALCKNKERRAFFQENESFRIRGDGKLYLKDEVWENIQPIKTSKLPTEIDDNAIFILPYDKENRFNSSRDGRPWGHRNKSRRCNFDGDRYMATCKGNFQCVNTECPYLLQYHEANRVQFSTSGKCQCCYAMATNAIGVVERIACPARKIWEFSNNSVVIKHYGEHTCKSVNKNSLNDLGEEIKKRPSTRPCELRRDVLGDMLRTGKPIEDIESKACAYVDRKKIAKAKKNIFNSDFQRLSEMQENYRKDDKYLIYRFNSKETNAESTYIFKTSQTSINMIKHMDRKGFHFLNSSPAYFDAKENRVRGKTTYTLSLYHPLLKRMIPLATMDCDGENFANAVMFFQTLNNALKEEGEEITFDPCLLVLDEKACNWNAIMSIYGQQIEERMVSCEFHFKQSVNRKSRSLSNSDVDKFKILCKNLLEATTPPLFFMSKKKLTNFIAEDSKREACLSDWFKWWVDRKQHIFRAFKPKFAPESNLAEVVHSQWVQARKTHLGILDAAVDDITEQITIKQQLKMFKDGSFTGGTGPSFPTLMKRSYTKQDTFLNVNSDSNESFSEGGCSPPSIRKKVGNAAESIWQQSDTDVPTCSKRAGGIFRSKRSNQFEIALKNAKSAGDTIKVDEQTAISDYSQEFKIRGNSSIYRLVIGEDLSCTCPFFNKKNTPCKHAIWVMVHKLQQNWDCDMLQQVHFSKEEIRNIFRNKCDYCIKPRKNEAVASVTPDRRTLRAKLLQTSTEKPIGYIDGDVVKPGESLGARPYLPEPQNDPYWLVKKEGNIKTCNGCFLQSLGTDVIARVEMDYSVRKYDDGSRQWKLSTGPRYYHPRLSCIQKRRLNFKIANNLLRVSDDSKLTEDIISDLEL